MQLHPSIFRKAQLHPSILKKKYKLLFQPSRLSVHACVCTYVCRASVRAGATGAIAPVNFWQRVQCTRQFSDTLKWGTPERSLSNHLGVWLRRRFPENKILHPSSEIPNGGPGTYSGAQNKGSECCLNQKGVAEGKSAVTPLSSWT